MDNVDEFIAEEKKTSQDLGNYKPAAKTSFKEE